MSKFETLTAFVLIFFSAFLSATEIALFTLSRFQIRSLKETLSTFKYRRIKKLLNDPSGLLITLLVLNELISVSLASLFTKFAVQTHDIIFASFSDIRFLNSWIVDFLLSTAIATPIVVIACEITPKVTGAYANQLIASLFVRPLAFIYDLFKPLRKSIQLFQYSLARVIGRTALDLKQEALISKRSPILKEADFLMLVEEGHNEGAIHENEYVLIQNVFRLDDFYVSQIMTPLKEVYSLTPEILIKDALIVIRSEDFSRIPVVKTSKPEVIGILYAKDLLRAKLKPDLLLLPISSLMKTPIFVNSNMRLSTLFRKFKLQQTHMAIVRDTNGENLGVVTMNDVLETLFQKKQKRKPGIK